MQLHNLVGCYTDLQHQYRNQLEQMAELVADKPVVGHMHNLENRTYPDKYIQGTDFDTCSTVAEQQ